MTKISLSYVMATRNRLPFLGEAMKRLVGNLQADEEIVIVDGASTDGSVEFLQELHAAGQIHQLISEPDKGEAHALNKGLLVARGELIKLITDDDAFYFPGIQACKRYMLQHPDIDVVGTEGIGTEIDASAPDSWHDYSDYRSEYVSWTETSRPFGFCGLGLMLRRRSLPLFGLFHTGLVRVDYEFTLRLTAGQAHLAWYTGCTWAHLSNPLSNSTTQSKLVVKEGWRLEDFYYGSNWSVLFFAEAKKRERVIERLKVPLYSLMRWFVARLPPAVTRPANENSSQSRLNIPGAFDCCDRWLAEKNLIMTGEFLSRRE